MPGSSVDAAPAAKRTKTEAAHEEAEFTPLQRVLLSSVSALKPLVSAYHNAPVTVKTIHSSRVEGTGERACFKRHVDLHVLGVVFARCTSTLHIEREDIRRAVEEDGVAIGRLFRMFNISPAFQLHNAGRVELAPEDTAASDAFDAVERFWRDYTLKGGGVECRIREVIRSDLFELPAKSLEPPAESIRATSALLETTSDDVVSSEPFSQLPPGFTAAQRMLLTANGNVERILSSYYSRPVSLLVVLNHRRASATFDRQVTLLLESRQLMIAKSTCFITNEHWLAVMDEEKLSIGELFRRFDVLPTFTLHATGMVPGGFWRQYELRAHGLTCQINETFDAAIFEQSFDEVDVVAGAPSGHGSYGF